MKKKKSQWLIQLHLYYRKIEQKSENIALKLKNLLWEGLHFGLHAAPFYTALAVKRDFSTGL